MSKWAYRMTDGLSRKLLTVNIYTSIILLAYTSVILLAWDCSCSCSYFIALFLLCSSRFSNISVN